MLLKSAFPSHEAYIGYLRDWFAGQAVSVVIESLLDANVHAPDVPRLTATLAYDVADALLAARTKGTPA